MECRNAGWPGKGKDLSADFLACRKKPRLLSWTHRVLLIWPQLTFAAPFLVLSSSRSSGCFSDFKLLSVLFSPPGKPFPSLLTWYVLADASFLFVFSARKRWNQLWSKFRTACLWQTLWVISLFPAYFLTLSFKSCRCPLFYLLLVLC